jgi:hypothetical protein
VHGDRIRIGPQELNFMFEKKNVRHGMFFVNRARRLPWIRPTIEMTKIIKLEERKRKWRELYLADFGIPMRMLGVKVPVPQWFCVVVGRHGDQRFFVTAYPIDQIEQKLSLPDAYPREDTPKGSS